MSRTPTGRLVRTPTGADMIIERRFKADVEDVWTSLTDSQSTARWFGPWEGEPGPGSTIRVQMLYEEGAPWCEARIDVCDAPSHLQLFMQDDHGEWTLELKLTTESNGTLLTFTQHLTKPTLAGDAGPGWEYYLDRMVASRTGEAMPTFDEYYPGQKPFYLEQVDAVGAGSVES